MNNDRLANGGDWVYVNFRVQTRTISVAALRPLPPASRAFPVSAARVPARAAFELTFVHGRAPLLRLLHTRTRETSPPWRYLRRRAALCLASSVFSCAGVRPCSARLRQLRPLAALSQHSQLAPARLRRGRELAPAHLRRGWELAPAHLRRGWEHPRARRPQQVRRLPGRSPRPWRARRSWRARCVASQRRAGNWPPHGARRRGRRD